MQPLQIQVQTNTHCFAEKQWVFSVLGSWMDIEFHFLPSESADYLLLVNGSPNKLIRIADHFFRDVQPGVYKNKHLPKERISIKLPDIEDTWYALYGSSSVRSTEKELAIDADLIGTAFFALSRWEEFQNSASDGLGRLPFENHTLARLGLAGFPFLDHWAGLFKQLLKSVGCHWDPILPDAKVELSCDIDIPVLWHHPYQRWKTLLGAIIKRYDLEEAHYWLTQPYLHEHTLDPCDTISQLMNLADKTGSKCAFYLLGNRPRNFDHYYQLNDSVLQRYRVEIQERGHQIGFHPSIQALKDKDQFESELASVRDFADQEITRVRSHYLSGFGPVTWRLFEKHGLHLDSSLGFHDQIGFRCGTAQAYQLFDWERSEMLSLVEQPLLAMDVSLVLAQNLSPTEAQEQLQRLLESTLIANGTFTLLWHNSSFYTWPWFKYRQIPGQLITSYV